MRYKNGKNLSGQSWFNNFIFNSFLKATTIKSQVVNRSYTNLGLVSTVLASDTGFFETAIAPLFSNFIIVDEYKTEEAAKKGHIKWLEYLNTRPKKLYDVHIFEWEETGL